MGIEACAGAHYLDVDGQYIRHTRQLMGGQFVLYVKADKNDLVDGEGIRSIRSPREAGLMNDGCVPTMC